MREWLERKGWARWHQRAAVAWLLKQGSPFFHHHIWASRVWLPLNREAPQTGLAWINWFKYAHDLLICGCIFWESWNTASSLSSFWETRALLEIACCAVWLHFPTIRHPVFILHWSLLASSALFGLAFLLALSVVLSTWSNSYIYISKNLNFLLVLNSI